MRTVVVIAFALIPVLVWGSASAHDTHQASAKRGSPARTGERVFSDNCARCHQAPTSLAPRITGTVIMHMRTRARLSAQDEKLLLEYLAP